MDGGGENLHMQVMEARKTVVLGPEHPDSLPSMNGLAAIYIPASEAMDGG
jgi:hypothetical protein